MPRVLIVAEQANQARVLAIGLRLEGFGAETVSGSDEALTVLAAQSYDFAIVDLMLPGTNGIQLARIVRDRHPGTNVVLMSAYHLSERQLDRADCGAVGFVPKPLDLAELSLFLRRKIRGGAVPLDLAEAGGAGELGGAWAAGLAGAAPPR